MPNEQLWLNASGNITSLSSINNNQNNIQSQIEQFQSVASFLDEPKIINSKNKDSDNDPNIKKVKDKGKSKRIYTSDDSDSDDSDDEQKKSKHHNRTKRKTPTAININKKNYDDMDDNINEDDDESITSEDTTSPRPNKQRKISPNKNDILRMKPASGFADHHQGIDLYSEENNDINRYVIPRSDGRDFTDTDVIPIVTEDGRIISSDQVANMMNKWHDPTIRRQFKSDLGNGVNANKWKRDMDKKISDEGGRFTPSWIKNFTSQLNRLESLPVYDFIKSVAGGLNVSRIELLLNQAELREREENIKESLRNVTLNYQNRVRAAEIAYRTVNTTQTRLNTAIDSADALFGYYMPIIDVAIRPETKSAIVDLVSVLSKDLFGKSSAPDIYNQWEGRLTEMRYTDLFLVGAYYSMMLSTNTTGKLDWRSDIGRNMQVLIDGVLGSIRGRLDDDTLFQNLVKDRGNVESDKDKQKEIVESLKKLTDKFKLPPEQTTRTSNVEATTLARSLNIITNRIRNITNRVRSLLLDTIQIFAYGVSTGGSVPNISSPDNAQILFLGSTISNSAKFFAERKLDNGEYLQITDLKGSTVKRNPPNAAVQVNISRASVTPYIPNVIFSTTLRESILDTQALLKDNYTIDDYDIVALEDALKNFDNILNPLIDVNKRWNNIELQIGKASTLSSMISSSSSSNTTRSTVNSNLSQFPSWATTQLANIRGDFKRRMTMGGRDIDANKNDIDRPLKNISLDTLNIQIFNPIQNIIDSLRNGITLATLAERCKILYLTMKNTSPFNSNDKNIGLKPYLFQISDEIVDLYTTYELSEKLSSEYYAHVFLDIRFGFWYILARYNFVRGFIQSITQWLISPIQTELVEASQRWSNLSFGATSPETLKDYIESPVVAQQTLTYLMSPENSGFINISPALQTAIDLATVFVREYSSEDSGFINFDASEIIFNKNDLSSEFKTLFVRIVVLKVVESRLLSPVSYTTGMQREEKTRVTKELQSLLKSYKAVGSKTSSLNSSSRNFINSNRFASNIVGSSTTSYHW